ncbi:MAG TPA: phosphatase PAP2 family protein [Thermomicrobiales bacterium]|nr:phosphatase PAP2 family protein [Thermomicrobiales bacterium]
MRLKPILRTITNAIVPEAMRTAGIAFATVALLLTLDGLLHPTTRFDVDAINSVQSLDAPYLAQLVTAVSTLTTSSSAITFWAVTLLTFTAIRWWMPALATATPPLGGLLDNIVDELIVGRARPDADLATRTVADIEAASFPSGHAMGAVMLYGLLFVVASHIERWWLRLAFQSFSVCVIVAVGFARIWERAHWPTDVLGASR